MNKSLQNLLCLEEWKRAERIQVPILCILLSHGILKQRRQMIHSHSYKIQFLYTIRYIFIGTVMRKLSAIVIVLFILETNANAQGCVAIRSTGTSCGKLHA